MAPTDIGRVAQSAERAPEKREVAGSTPAPATSKTPCSAGVLLFGRPARLLKPSGSVPHPCHNERADDRSGMTYRQWRPASGWLRTACVRSSIHHRRPLMAS
jgi:hypothetical protein